MKLTCIKHQNAIRLTTTIIAGAAFTLLCSHQIQAQEPSTSRSTASEDIKTSTEATTSQPNADKSLSAEVGLSHENLTNGFDSWSSQYLLLIKKWEQRKAAYGSITRAKRFGLRDTEFLGGVYWPLGKNTTAHLEGSTSSHRFLARWSAFGEVSQQIGKGRFLNAGFRHSKYNGNDVSTPQLGIEQYFGPYRVMYTLLLPELEGERKVAHVLQGNYYYSERYSKSNVGLNLSFGEEADLIAPNTLATYRVRGATVSGLHYFKDDWALKYSLGVTNQGDVYTRRGFTLGVRHEF
jgi:YaiO family outer membrane protein